MSEPIASLDGRVVPLSDARVSVHDLGLVQGAAVTEMIRTFRHLPFELDRHLNRLLRSLKVVGFGGDLTLETLRERVNEVVAHNATLIPEHHDLGIVAFVTAGANPTYVGSAGAGQVRQPTVGVHTFPLPFELWAEKLEHGQHLVTPSIRHVPADSIDPRLKMRSRLFWYMADAQARLVDPKAGALLLDHDGFVTETSSANFLYVSEGAICAPGAAGALGGTSQRRIAEFAAAFEVPMTSRPTTMYDVLNADEAFTSSTPYCLLPVTKANGQPIGSGRPGPVFERLISAWSEHVGLDVAEQIRTVARERTA